MKTTYNESKRLMAGKTNDVKLRYVLRLESQKQLITVCDPRFFGKHAEQKIRTGSHITSRHIIPIQIDFVFRRQFRTHYLFAQFLLSKRTRLYYELEHSNFIQRPSTSKDTPKVFVFHI